jgi:methylmalonyl-CoA mutase C-terminal domain/subunit
MAKKIRVLIAKPGLDGHDRGAKVVAKAFMEAGMEVIYTGIRKTPEQIAHIALQEDVDVVGLSSLSGGHNTLFVDVARWLAKVGKKDVLLLGGGIVPEEDVLYLKQNGFAEIFAPGTDTKTIAEYIISRVYPKLGNE